jgi:hypothetical protein
MPLDDLPAAFVIRPSFGAARKGVYVMVDGVDLLTGVAYTRETLRTRLREQPRRRFDPLWLVEEFVQSEHGGSRLPVEYRCHAFGDVIGAIEVVVRATGMPTRYGFFTPEWRLLDVGYTNGAPLDAVDPPKCLDEMLACARRLGEACETYVRADFYSSDKGCVFGEFSSTPARGDSFTAFINDYFERLWRENLRDRI